MMVDLAVRSLTVALSLVCAMAHAQVVGLGTTQAGATNQLSVGIAKVVSDKGGVQLRTQPMAGAAQYAPLVNAGEIEFGISNVVELHYLAAGRVITEGREHKNLRMAARLVPWYNGLVVKRDSPYKTVRDLKGAAVPYGFTGNPLGRVMIDAFLANGGLTVADVKPYPVPAFPRMFDAFKQQQTVTSISVIGAAQMQEWESALGGVRFLSLDRSPEAIAATARHAPQSTVAEVQPRAGMLGVIGPTNLVLFDYTLWVGAKVADELVGKVLAALHDHAEALKSTTPLFREFEASLMGKDLGLPYHQAAERFYRSKGIWPAKH